MEAQRVYLGAGILIALLVFSNLIVYGIARGLARGAKHAPWMKAAQDALRDPRRKENEDIDELRRRLNELEEKPGEEERPS